VAAVSAADAGGIIGGYLAPLFQRRWGLSLEDRALRASAWVRC
jgi:hypothetical protein